MSHSILTNTAISAGGRTLNIVLGILVTAIVTRWLGPATFGYYVLLLALGSIVQLLADGGLYLTLTRTIAEQPSKKNEIISNIISLRAILLFCAFLLGGVAVAVMPGLAGMLPVYIILAIGLIAQSLSQLLMGIYQNEQNMWGATGGDLAGRLLQIFIIFILGSAAGLSGVSLAFMLGAAATFLLHNLFLPRQIKWRVKFNYSNWRELVAVSWPIGFLLLVNAVYFRIDTLILSFFNSATEVGWYGLAYRIIESMLFFPAMLGGLLLPRISEFLLVDKNKARQLIEEGLKLLALTGALAVILIIIAAPEIINLVAGPLYFAAAPWLKILSAALFIMFLGNLFGFALMALKKQLALLKLYLTLMIVNLLLNLIFIPFYGAAAAAWTTVATEAIATIGAFIMLNRALSLKFPVIYLLKVLCALAVTIIMVDRLFFTSHIIIQVVLAVAGYVGITSALGLMSAKSLYLLRLHHGKN